MVAHGVRLAHVDAFLAVASKREVRRYADRPIPPETEQRILEAGRVSGSSKNRQPWRFVVLSDREAIERAAEAVWAADNVLGAALVIGVIVRGKGPVSFDAGRAAQNMMLAAWGDGIGSCPNGIADPEALAAVLGHDDDEQVVTVLSFGYPARPARPESRTPDEWIERADRLAFDDVVEVRS
jgi:nitroreductase